MADCSSYWQSIFNPTCWMQDPFGIQAGGSTVQSDIDSCMKAANGNVVLAAQCVQQKQQTEKAMQVQDPAGASDYNAAINGDILDLVNPFTGSGPLAGTPTWVLAALAIGGGLLALQIVAKR